VSREKSNEYSEKSRLLSSVERKTAFCRSPDREQQETSTASQNAADEEISTTNVFARRILSGYKRHERI